MALHGEIKVNGVGIGRWEAVRKHPAFVGGYEYACAVELNGRQSEFVVEHRYGDGAAALAAKVLSQGAERLGL